MGVNNEKMNIVKRGWNRKMAVKIISATHRGLDGVLINVEVDITRGIPSFNIVGLPDTSIKESKERVRLAIVNSGYEFPLGLLLI